jgi:hypothetical protein
MKKKMNQMTKTNEKYTYEDFLLRKHVLKQEIKDMEKMISMEQLPQILGIVGSNMKNKALDLIRNPNALSLLIDIGMGLGTEKFISRFINKKSTSGKIALITSTYLIPLAISKGKNIITKILTKRENNP